MLDYGFLPVLNVGYYYRSVLTIAQLIVTSGNLRFKG